jgi:hypothetical protein
VGNLTQSWIEGLGCVSWHTLRSTCGGYSFCYEDEVLEALVMSAVADHRGGDAFDEDAASAVKDRVRVTMTYGNMLSVHTTYPL